ncbi:DNA packaging protein UL32 [Columbid alphaherpesvirus 1]|uniref:Packaging protein UL32 n=1 Tax=Columbid alphaherpesvirus 1 TaxID=93386 RepID=A0A1V0M8H1_9ALPH|nr:DNA packaging protein UL32 [Columbid alphaherpesvirus 1]ARD71357.1 DNA packaging protein UL32 [Columbid alphaherpesvirus 1]
MARPAAELSPFDRSVGDAEGWAEEAFDRDYCAFDPELLALNDDLFNELLLSAHAIRIGCDAVTAQADGDDLDGPDAAEMVDQTELSTFVDTASDVFALDRPCLVCRTLDVYRRDFGFSALWMADYAFLCAKCLGAPPCATVTFIAGFEFVYIMDKHFLGEHGATLVGSFGRRVLTHEDVQRHFFLHGCFRTDGGVPGRKPDEIIMSKPRPGRPTGGRAGPATLGSAKVLYSNYSFLAQSATRAMMATLADCADKNIQEAVPQPTAGANGTTKRAGSSHGPARDSKGNPGSGTGNKACPVALAVALAGWKECARSVECGSANGRRGDSCALRAAREDDEYEAEQTCASSDPQADVFVPAYASLFPGTSGAGEGPSGGFPLARETDRGSPDSDPEEEKSWAYADLTLLLLAGTGAAPLEASRDFTAIAAKVRKETVDAFWSERRTALAKDVAPRYARFYEEDAEPDLDLGPVMVTQLKHSLVRGKTSAECLPCNLMVVKDYWMALRQFKREVIAYSANNVGLFHSVSPVLDEWADENRLKFDDGKRFINLLRSAGPEALYKHFFCDPMCAARVAQTNPRALFEHPRRGPAEGEELTLYKARLASHNRFEGRVCAGLWALSYAFKTYQVFPPRPTALAAFVKDAGALLYRHSISLVSLEHTLGVYV